MTFKPLRLLLPVLLLMAAGHAKIPKWLQQLIKISGVTSNVSEVQSENEAPEGALVVEDLVTRKIRALGSGESYRSPIFSPEDDQVLALKGDTVFAFDAKGGTGPKMLFVKAGLIKLIGTESRAKWRILALRGDAEDKSPVLLNLSGRETPIDLPPPDDSLRNVMIGSLAAWSRQYGDTLLQPVERRPEVSGPAPKPWGVEIKVKGKSLDAARGQAREFHFTQPSLSNSRGRMVMVRTPL